MFRKITAILTAALLTAVAGNASLAAAPVAGDEASSLRKAPAELAVTWDHIPYDRMKQKYPAIAKQRKQPGSVLVSCDWGDNARVTDCEIIRETPEDYGFGAATLEIMKEATVKSKTKGEAVKSGKGLKLFVNWKQ